EVIGDNYELPNETAYCETCAAISNAMWNHRMFLLHGDAKYLDVLERVLYNGFISGVSFSGKEYFYPNPLASDGEWEFNKGAKVRQAWFGCSCCPTNVVRFLPSLPGYAYAVKDDVAYVNLFMGSGATLDVNGQTVRLAQETNFPWDGLVKVVVDVDSEVDFELRIRIPGWAQGEPVPSDLYRYVDEASEAPTLTVNGEAIDLNMDGGFACVRRTWQRDDSVDLSLAMAVKRVVSHESVEANKGRVAIERGPILFCAEAVDNGVGVRERLLSKSVDLAASYRADLLHGVVVLSGDGWTLIPYYAWCHRGANEMAVWLKSGQTSM
ncbi:MAG: glycoside hydrolase family 127 protein, partial [Candidatus Latescibacterota bacterium]